ncbi:serine-type D-Ala-D-Ala carboxypeptidase/endopeptidase (penicillin-binding protein 4) [Cupriavidus metallidurans]|jgi:D-alanyl-D-alanine carboxypeptidase/D-alanyl-D-alanine-endopeptidase (penicillin-binding protein 4)|uniref:D-Alanyl-D-alanine carboxypeptidase, S13 family n=1 Tax=Cupriavidus metallidurans (strain ATCC 43123 / DSM 2839 / NBRC 102507 / CH34) TaxID=266264 RepID=Q1LR32_CUPMC|nr:D-alanyl-D-alanine carboxypeptidase/D-alanyl-D-alanine-endopeptidase [Cupriavidus metallidurans]ABF07394.1 D-Alanyl-D-alanine carboxypeptidase, S13 family [Cupriavidus metallidurans CH34]AVA32643.1 D-alanyl-D-alanine carboxypeptidase [Cupriavidus metallidurans]MDE4916805.1 D-alanyl-D-alanine carboxypeptidase/D-alanyl-D-alanine-endopeptidase [Cupriavidus metallidurans]QGS28274.1 D-alanyl-D-alanine carboxypeptidase [Cupriavidus metallidurans]
MSAMPIRPSLLRRSLSPVIATAALLAFGLTGAQAKPVKSVKATKPSVQRVSAEAADPAAARTGLPATVTTALRRAHVPLSAASFYVIKVGAPRPRVSWNAEAPMNPASTMKLVTTFAGLQLLGPDYRWLTSLYADGQPGPDGVINGNVYLRGRGDPKLVPEEMAKLVNTARSTGATAINGDLVLDRSFFADTQDNSYTIDGETQRAYNVNPDALLYAFKTLTFTITPDAAGRAVDVAVTPALAQLRVDNRLTLVNGRCGDWRARANPSITPQSDGTIVAAFDGNYSADCGEHVVNLATLSHSDFIWGGFVAEWQAAGGRFVRPPGLRGGTVPRGAFLLARHYGQPLGEIVRDINKFSNNVMARQLFLTIGAEIDRSGPASTEKSTRVIKRWLSRQGLDMPDLVLENGSGLSREERISAYDMARLLQQALASNVGPVLMDSLPILGVDGTLRNRLTRANAAGNAYLKTGTLQDVRALAGYVDALDGQRYVVVAYINHPNASGAQEAHDALMQWVYKGTP